jgi:hypothetical protein
MLNAYPIVVRHSSRISICGFSFRVVHELIADELNCLLDRADQWHKIVVEKFIFRLKVLQKSLGRDKRGCLLAMLELLGRGPLWVKMRNPHCEQMFSALLPTSGVIRSVVHGRLRLPHGPVGHPAR